MAVGHNGKHNRSRGWVCCAFAVTAQHMFANEANVLLKYWAARCNAWLLIILTPKGVLFSFLLLQLVLCFQIKAVPEGLKHPQAAPRAFLAALRSAQEALGRPPSAQGKCACCCKCCCQRRQPHPCHSPLTLLLLLLQGNAKHRSKHFPKHQSAATKV